TSYRTGSGTGASWFRSSVGRACGWLRGGCSILGRLGHRSQYLLHAKQALYHLSWTPSDARDKLLQGMLLNIAFWRAPGRYEASYFPTTDESAGGRILQVTSFVFRGC